MSSHRQRLAGAELTGMDYARLTRAEERRAARGCHRTPYTAVGRRPRAVGCECGRDISVGPTTGNVVSGRCVRCVRKQA